MTKFHNYDLTGQLPVLSWNPIVMRCPGCELSTRDAKGWIPCWHLRMCNRMMHNPTIPVAHREVYAGNAGARRHNQHEDAPLRRKKPAIIATQFMGDISAAPIGLQEDVFRCMALASWHTFLVLTKWPEQIVLGVPDNCWIGTSVTDQATAGERISALMRTGAKHLWVSVEPMLGPVDLSRVKFSRPDCEDELVDVLRQPSLTDRGREIIGRIAQIDFVACGPETAGGKYCSSFLCDWLFDVQLQCAGAGVPFYDKRDPIHCGLMDFEPVREWPEEWKK